MILFMYKERDIDVEKINNLLDCKNIVFNVKLI